MIEVAEALGRSRTTVNRWIRHGLPTLSPDRSPLILGAELRDWLKTQRDARKHPCALFELYCCHCHLPRAVASGSGRILQRSLKTVAVQGRCAVCNTRMKMTRSRSDLSELERHFGSMKPELPALDVCPNPGADSLIRPLPILPPDQAPKGQEDEQKEC
ncbi:helix-turn-helix domain-containing protein [Methyloligella solikamskensis]|uniref:Helix-turn-helix domain-containing protein n=1 Tax=Methyloligella solikamskensis TaxID=1177756 RepID=A0ABW3J4Z8_9HYPH